VCTLFPGAETSAVDGSGVSGGGEASLVTTQIDGFNADAPSTSFACSLLDE